MRYRIPLLFSLIVVVVCLASTGKVLGSLGIAGKKGDSFQSKVVTLKGFRIGKGDSQPAGEYSFKIIGTGKPGVDVQIIDSAGKEVGKTTGRFAGKCPGKPLIATFAELGYSKESPIKAVEGDKATLIIIECERGSRIEFTLDAAVE